MKKYLSGLLTGIIVALSLSVYASGLSPSDYVVKSLQIINSRNEKVGMSYDGNKYGDLSFYENDLETLRIQSSGTKQGWSFIPQNGASTVYVDPVFTGTIQGAGTTLIYDNETKTLTLKDSAGKILSSIKLQ